MAQFQHEITEISNGCVGAASTFFELEQDQRIDVLNQLKKFNIEGGLIWCLYKHVYKENVVEYVKHVLEMTERPTTCPWDVKCDWNVYEERKTQSGLPYHVQCANQKCRVRGKHKCGACFSVRYCTKECQSADRQRHTKECNGVITAVKLASSQGKDYSKSIITGMISMDDTSFDKLWKKHICPNPTNKPPTYVRVKLTKKITTINHDGYCSGSENVSDETIAESFTTRCDTNGKLLIGTDLTNQYASVEIEVDREDKRSMNCASYIHATHGALSHCTVTEIIAAEVVFDKIDTPHPSMVRHVSSSTCPPESRHLSPARFTLDNTPN